MARISGVITPGTFEVKTLHNAITLTASKTIPVYGAKKITLFLKRANHTSGSTTLSVDGSLDGTNFVAFNKIITNVTNTNAQTLTRVASVALSSNTTTICSLDLTNDTFAELKFTATIATDGDATLVAFIEY